MPGCCFLCVFAEEKKHHKVLRRVVCRLHCGWNMSFTGSTVHIYGITSIDMAPEGTDGLSCMSMFHLKVFPYNRPGLQAVHRRILAYRSTITA